MGDVKYAILGPGDRMPVFGTQELLGCAGDGSSSIIQHYHFVET
jgi:hypothetical protein